MWLAVSCEAQVNSTFSSSLVYTQALKGPGYEANFHHDQLRIIIENSKDCTISSSWIRQSIAIKELLLIGVYTPSYPSG